jgi:Tfp pilus assembly protein PilP
MKTKFFVLALVFFYASSILYPGLSPQGEKKMDQEKKDERSLIRKELLVLPDKSFPPPKRNIFTRGRTQSASEADEISPSENIQETERIKSPGQPGQQETTANKISINVKYIGYVKSGKKVVALILIGSETYAVESGDVLEVGMTIGKITPDDMEIFNQGSEPIRINLEGERP